MQERERPIEKAKRKYRKFTDEFKREAVRLLNENPTSAVETAKKLDIPQEHLYRWRDELSASGVEAFRGNGKRTAGQERIRELEAEVRRLRMGARLSKKNSLVLRQGRRVRYSAIRQHEGAYPTRLMCRVLEVTPSGYYAWRRRPKSLRERNRKQLESIIRMIFLQAREVYGSPRITAELKDIGLQHSRNFVAKVMKEAGIKAKAARRRFKRTTNSEHSEPVFPNVLKRNFRTLAPNSAWVSDVTYIRTKEGWLYLCVFIDLYSRQVVGWSIKDRLCFEIATDALEMALGQRDPKPGLVFILIEECRMPVHITEQSFENGRSLEV